MQRKMIVKKSNLAAFFIALAVYFPGLFSEMGYGDMAGIYINTISLFCLLWWGLSKLPIDRWSLFVILYAGSLLVSAVVNESLSLYVLALYVRMVALSLGLWLCFRKNLWGTIHLLKNFLGILSLINLLTLIVAPNGIMQLYREENEWYQYYVPIWLFGNKNSMIMWVLPANMLAQIEGTKTGRKRVWNTVIVIMSFLTALLAKSSTSIVTTGLLTGAYVFQKRIVRIARKIGKKTIMLSYFVLQLLLMTSNELGLFRLVSTILGKNTSFTGRTTAWSNSLSLISQEPLLGYGFLTAEKSREALGAYAFVNAHNTLLDILLAGGAVAAFFYVAMIYRSIDRLNSGENKTLSTVLVVSSVCLLLQASLEAYTYNTAFWVIFLMIYEISFSTSLRREGRC